MSHTVIQVPVPALEPVIRRLAPAPPCPHITVLGPFVDRGDVGDDLVNAIRRILEPARAFDFQLSTVGHFAGGHTYLAPDPAEPFIQLTGMFVAAFPQWPPYGGAFDEVVPHLSIGEALSEPEVAMVRQLLPIRTTADEVTLTWWSEHDAEVLVRFPLRAQRRR
ncbi:2'-5' RNA ligase family protein [Cellulomonas xiejunii]|uniref:2'-5' RNA ligase family protein n=1 Tax=Cellulomonas xiejunii TaxID=2968083 RepID=A0ABY5KN54_9CELL|nr:2'-5' RNA ligase family protein [Cellulomonas xiejunii]MCC2321309.1 2'-5' RNA ligase family protein [Cellulomonas xiejunii]UUI71896.1 2'-5' RNA ligase family protein [Cellulomonas xiejunii]